MSLNSPWKYPFDGFTYFFTHPSLWKRIIFGLFILICLSLTIIILFFVYLYPLQVNYLSLSIVRWLSILLSLLLTLFEFGFVLLIISCLFLTFRLKTLYEIVWKEEFGENYSSIDLSLIHSFYSIFIFRSFLFILTFPLNLIPILGTILFLYINSYYYSWSLHYPYFHSIGLTFQQGRHFVQTNEKSYRQFGFVALILELIPLINILSPITNLIGSILWIIQMEKCSTNSPRSYLISATPSLIEQGNQQYYGTTPINDEKSLCPPPPSYNDSIENNQQIYPSAPQQDEK